MKLAHLAVGPRSFYLSLGEVEEVMAGAAEARDNGEWMEFHDAGGELWRLLLPHEMLLVVHEVERDIESLDEPNDWSSYDYDL